MFIVVKNFASWAKATYPCFKIENLIRFLAINASSVVIDSIGHLFRTVFYEYLIGMRSHFIDILFIFLFALIPILPVIRSQIIFVQKLIFFTAFGLKSILHNS